MAEERMRERKEVVVGVGMRLCVLFLIRGTIDEAVTKMNAMIMNHVIGV